MLHIALYFSNSGVSLKVGANSYRIFLAHKPLLVSNQNQYL